MKMPESCLVQDVGKKGRLRLIPNNHLSLSRTNEYLAQSLDTVYHIMCHAEFYYTPLQSCHVSKESGAAPSGRCLCCKEYAHVVQQ